MLTSRASGVLAHITSLPGPFGVGDVGPEARRFVDFLALAGQRYWQVLPLHPTQDGAGHSPYSSTSAYAGNPLLISPEDMLEQGLLEADAINAWRRPGEEDVARFDWAQSAKIALCAQLQKRLQSGMLPELEKDFLAFCRAQADWLEGYALFAAAKEYFGPQHSWTQWPEGLRQRQPQTLNWWRHNLGESIELHKLTQYLFFRQWQRLHEYCRQKNVALMGDVPIYVDFESADVWSHPEFFKLEDSLQPPVVAGVPPDYFSATGQRWGNPVYDWPRLAQDNFQWWVTRLEGELELCDVLRLDHFRGFAACWEVPVEHETAENGTWVPVPGADLFDQLHNTWGRLPFIAEDLGYITDDVRRLKYRYALPGMALLVFAFDGDPYNAFLPENHEPNLVVYTGTHDTNTVRGWFEEETTLEQHELLQRYFGRPVSAASVSREMVQLALESRALTVVLPLQDILGLGSEARMNVPAAPNGNWQWRVLPEMLDASAAHWLAEQTAKSGRGGRER
ncbi:MAG: 4-alpha-glucanotransferase [Desulfohalobium sp.]